MAQEAGLIGGHVKFFKAKAANEFSKSKLYIFKGNRKSAGFNEDPEMQIKLLKWMWQKSDSVKADVWIIMDPALLFVVNDKWEQATIDLLRGGVYTAKHKDGYEIQILVMAPISSINRGMKPKDIAALNQGFDDKQEWEDWQNAREVGEGSDEDDESDDESVAEDDVLPPDAVRVVRDDSSANNLGEHWYEPVVIPFGHFCFSADLNKLGRLLREIDSKAVNAK
jgi:hypothetical protein